MVESTWPDEIEKWGFNLKYQLIRHTSPARRIAQMENNADVYAINYEMLHWLGKPEFKKWFRDIDIVIFDELTKLKSTKATPFRLFRGRRDWFKRRWGLTGTMVPESYVDLYGQLTVLEKVWPDKTTFLDKYFRDESHDTRYSKWELRNKKAKKKLQKKVAPYTFTLDSADYLDVPEATVIDYWFDLSPKQRKFYDQLEKQMYAELGSDPKVVKKYLLKGEDADSLDIDAETVTTMRLKLRQCISGFMYDEQRRPLVFDKTKSSFAEKILADYDENVLMIYQLVQEREQLSKQYKAPVMKTKAVRDKWNRRKLPRTVGHPMSMGHGLNLQDGGRVLFFYSLPRAFEQYAQTIARLIRTGQTENVVIARLLARNTIDETIVKELRRKEKQQNGFIQASKIYEK